MCHPSNGVFIYSFFQLLFRFFGQQVKREENGLVCSLINKLKFEYLMQCSDFVINSYDGGGASKGACHHCDGDFIIFFFIYCFVFLNEQHVTQRKV